MRVSVSRTEAGGKERMERGGAPDGGERGDPRIRLTQRAELARVGAERVPDAAGAHRRGEAVLCGEVGYEMRDAWGAEGMDEEGEGSVPAAKLCILVGDEALLIPRSHGDVQEGRPYRVKNSSLVELSMRRISGA